jgi:ElaB/YqjD/DUF883 family membrane-anchored ribosome-binding protein
MDQKLNVTKDKLISDLNLIVSDAEELLHATASEGGQRVSELRGRLQEHLARAKAGFADAKVVAIDRATLVGEAADGYVHDHPWPSVGVAAGFGLIVGLLIGRQ